MLEDRVPEVLSAVLAATAAGELDTLFPESAALTGTGTGKKLAQSKR